MKRIAISIISFALCQTINAQEQQPVKDSFYSLSPVEVKAVRAGENAPFAKSDIGKKVIEKTNIGQDIPFLLNQTPSVVINSDAGNGVGYTGIRIRGTDATRINVTLNGIPYNDAESQGTFFVDLPDYSSSAGSLQIQRGVGTSSNGAGAFGGSINFSTNEVNKETYCEINNGVGSFNTWKNTVKAGTGLLGNHFTTDVRLSNISSDGFIDRASSKLQSLYLSSAYIGNTNSLRLNIFSGKEKTYQAWYGISQADLDAGNRTVNYAGTEKPGQPYDNETDNYTQTHYQLFYNQLIAKKIAFNTAFFMTRGKGYYEQYKANEEYSKYGLPDAVINNVIKKTSDFIRQLWLDNKFYGNIFSFQYDNKTSQFTLGGGYTKYEGQHYGKLIWASNGLTGSGEWYLHHAFKNDFNLYFKQQTEFAKNWYLFYDLQYRHIRYDINGFRDNPSIVINTKSGFFNPKAGITFSKNGWKTFLSYSLAAKEPNRDDYEAGNTQQPTAEKLRDLELGITKTSSKYNWSATFYYMQYKDQLVLTGKINDVGAYTRTNIPNSYRTGLELEGGVNLCKWANASANIALSRNKVKDFTEYIDDYDNGGQKPNKYKSPDIAYSPNIVSAASINFLPIKKMEISLLSKYVSKQYLDNTQNESRKLYAFYVQDIRCIFTLGKNKWTKEITLIGQANNIFNKKYEPNGYTYSYIYNNELTTENYYFPMAGTNFMLALNIKL